MTSQDDPMSLSEENAERLSAYLDGEVTPVERAAAEALLAQSSDAAQTLDEYRQLSGALRELRQAAPSDLQTGIMSRIGAEGSPLPRAASAGRKRLVSVVAGLAGLAASAVLLLWPGSSVQQVERNLAGQSLEFADSSADASPAFEADGISHLPSTPSLPSEYGAVGGATTSMPSPAAASVEMSFARRFDETAEMEGRLQRSLDELTRERPLPEVGDIVGYLDANADELTWVAVTVVDVQSAGDQVQLMLTRNGVATPPAFDDSLTPEPPQESLSIVVEADWDQLEAVIVDLSDAEFVDTVMVDAPVDEDVPDVLQGYAISRTDEAAAGKTNAAAIRLKNQVVSRGARSAGRPQPTSRQASPGNGVQLPALVPDVELKRIAGLRSAEEKLTESVSRKDGAPAARPGVNLASRPPAVSPPLKSSREQVPGRAKVVFVIKPVGS